MSTITDSSEIAAAPARKVDQLLAHYGESHRNPRNEAIHFVAIPLIILSLLRSSRTCNTCWWVPCLS